ncbi:MAG: FtsQ-type POTRA domain-containing protein, partial [Verrucomicrobiota bacterium]
MTPRVMTASGRWRRTLAAARTGAVVAIVGALAWGAWEATAAFRQNAKAVPAVAKSVPIKRLELHTDSGGVLDHAWLQRTLALPKGISLVELDLERLRERVLADGQVTTATLTRDFPDRLVVHVTERSPVARISLATDGTQQTCLVARDGVVYQGSNYERAMVQSLPWLAGFRLKPQGVGFRPIAEMDVVADLLARAQYEATHLYLTWQIVSLERLAEDRELEVTMKNGARVIFSVNTDFFPQLAKLDRVL